MKPLYFPWLALCLYPLITVSVNSCQAPGPESRGDVHALVMNTPAKGQIDNAERMAMSVMKRNPEAWMTDFRKTPRWSYTNGLVMLSFLELWKETGEQKYYDYAKSYADTMIDDNGDIKGYSVDEFNIDHINPGKMLFPLFDESGDKRYEKTLHTLRLQLQWQPRTSEGGFWHKRRYPWQMWLDGLYMGSPFYAEYASRYNEPEAFDDIARQFQLIQQHTVDPETGLMYHGWDESHIQAWSDPETGLSPHFWSRAMGWYGMAMVDVLDFIPDDHPGRQAIIGYLNDYAKAVANVQDEKTGLWYQVLDLPDRKGNYLEATGSCMFVYALFKGVNNGYLPDEFSNIARKGYDGLMEHLVEIEEDGEIHLHKCCSVAGLGGSPYRDGSFDYYISEKVRSNDPKGVGPFILASLEYDRFLKMAGQ